MTSAAPDEPEFATSLYVPAANLGVVLRAAVRGGFIEAIRMQGTVWSGWLFAALAMAAVLARKPWRSNLHG
ncbi:hypothetical protein [Agrobacterium tumefaciens]|uniref:hypothetical protein n=1 Tax=Agrobacterium tumefaciens TaxID=358 RepID=UPI0021D36066|nr:hypothetical protein [Agrobacterium tumefaciens]